NPTSVIASSSNNIFWVENANGILGFALGDRSTLMNYAANISAAAPTDGNERGSALANPNFIGALNLDFNGPTAAAKSAVPLTTVLTDQRGNLRDTLNPTIGAYETLIPLADSSAPVISNVVATGGLNPVVQCTIADNGDTTLAANILLWYRPLSSTGAFLSLPPDSVPLNSINGIYKWSVSLDTLNWGSYEFYLAARDLKAPGTNIAVNPIQSTLSFAFGANDPVNYSLNPALFGSGAVPVRVFTKTSMLAGGTYSVGPTGNFPNLTAVANMLNAAALTGNVVFELQPNYDGTIGETFPITFTKFQTVGGNWHATIRPSSGASNLMLSGTHATTLINLNGVSNLTINGRATGAGSNAFAITNTSNTGSAIQFINNAQHNTIKNVSITGNSNLTTSGVVVFSNTTGTSSVDGNNNNLMDSCLISGNANARNCVLALGSASPAENKNNTITNCHVVDFFSNVGGETANGIVINDGNTLWNIGTVGHGNYFYQTAARTPSSIPSLTNAVNFKAIHINTATGSGFNIIDNRIGGNIPSVPSSTFVIGDNTTNVALTVRLIEINNVGSGLPISIQGNTITGISVVSTTANFFSGIFCSAGRVNVGNIAANIVGSKNTLNAINLINRGTSSLANIYGIRYAATSGIIANNEVGGFTVEQQQASGSSQFIGIYVSGAITDSLSISNNLVGSLTVPHSIQVSASSLGGVNLFGLVASSASGAPVMFMNNVVTNLTVFNTISSVNNTLKGIYVTGTSSVLTRISGNQVNRLICHSTNTGTGQNVALMGIGTLTSGSGRQDISDNTIHTLIAVTPVVSAVNVDGVYYGSTSTATTNSITRNRIHTLYSNVLNTLAIVDGINMAAGTNRVQVSNNMVALGFDSAGNSFIGNTAFAGINRSGGVATIVFNSVLIAGGGVASGIVNTFAFIRSSNAADSLYNNLFMNNRTNATTGGNHYAIGLNNTTGISINYNNYFATPLGAFNAVAQAGLTDWKLATAQDANSVSTTIQTVSNTDLHLTGSSIGNTMLGGVAIGYVSTDIDNQPRHVFPYMGADEIPASPLPVALLYFSGSYKANGNELNWETANERNASHFDVEYSEDGKQFTQVAQVKARGNASAKSTYQYTHKTLVSDHTTQYYRLKMVDYNQYWEYSRVISLSNHTNAFNKVKIYPNPTHQGVMLQLHAESEQLLTIVIRDMAGKIIHQSSTLVYQGLNEMKLSEVEWLKPGVYYVQVAEKVFKLVKQN
ncbi:MAG: T9SS C-terminal target domain-containing protein, partial [Bacteroidetes bacterium]